MVKNDFDRQIFVVGEMDGPVTVRQLGLRRKINRLLGTGRVFLSTLSNTSFPPFPVKR